MIDPSKSWRRFVNIHPAAERDPLPSLEELREIGKDILNNGMENPIVAWFPGEGDGNQGTDRLKKDAVLLDGRSRLDALEAVGVEFEQKNGSLSLSYIDGSGTEYVGIKYVSEKGFTDVNGRHWPGKPDPYSYADTLYLHRRHLSLEQKRERARKILKSSPGSSDRTIAEQAKLSPSTIGKLREVAGEDESGVQIGHLGVTDVVKTPPPAPDESGVQIGHLGVTDVAEAPPPPTATAAPPPATGASPEPKRRTGKDGKSYSVKPKKGKANPKAAISPKDNTPQPSAHVRNQMRSLVIEDFAKWFGGLSGIKLAQGLEDIVKLLDDHGLKIRNIPVVRRVLIAQSMLDVLGIKSNDPAIWRKG
jgi:hypothetical protein